MKRYDIRAIIEATDLVALVSEYTELKRHGRQYRGRCPFHEEKTPSFYVNPDKQAWYCWGACHTGGNAIAFLERNGKKFGEALRYLAERAGVPAVDEPARMKSVAEKHDEEREKAECEMFWQLVRSSMVRFSNDIWDLHRRACRWMVRTGGGGNNPRDQWRRAMAWISVDLLPLAEEARELIDVLDQSRFIDQLKVFRECPTEKCRLNVRGALAQFKSRAQALSAAARSAEDFNGFAAALIYYLRK